MKKLSTFNFQLSTTRGFTLIELLVVIAIIGILSSVVLVSLQTTREKGRDASAKVTMASIQVAAELYYDDNGSRYGGICDLGLTTEVGRLRAAVKNQTGTDTGCEEKAQSYAVDVVLNNAETFCVDSKGFSGVGKTAGITSGTPDVAECL